MNRFEDASLMDKNKNVKNDQDLIWDNPHPISLNFKVASEKALAIPIMSLTSLQDVQILYFRDLPFNAILPVARFKHGFTPAKGIHLGKAYYFPYLTPPDPSNFWGTVGNVEVKISPSSNDPQYVLTGEMNGCALIVTKPEGDDVTFRVWHFPSPDSHKTAYEEFKKKFKGQIYGEIKYSDYGGDELKGDIDAVNYLYYNPHTGLWELSCIPIRRIIERDPAKLALWNGNWIGTSEVPRFKKDLNFFHPIE
ncbi:hypothetical protein D1631_11495 [Chryseobacterium nematophagum]|uniref:Uncharacterized protein n=1 Tax=Chryseobacterium nematophagum TaxID=2305228 RepID=A0A3M7TG00_9FLAO|nr:hypothetical protein [Chryseobacterium nematophagum]RNA62513.1 hypothetical protein D1631_11495 [Chryseobacterium nematophagum]